MANESKNEIVTAGTKAITATESESFLTEIAQEMEGLGDISFDSIKIPSGGGLAFEVPGEDPENPDIAKEISGVVLVRRSTNGYWKDPFGGDNKTPDCYSSDGKVGVEAATGECRDCVDCPRNQFKEDGSGKDCKNMQNLYIVREGELLPVRLVLPPTSIKNLKDYIAKRLLFRGKKLGQVVTGITLSKAESRQGIKYAVAQFSKKRDLTPQEIAELAPMKQLVEKVLEHQKNAPATEYAEVPAEKYTEVPTDDDLPF